MTEQEAREKTVVGSHELTVLDILLNFGPIMPNSAKLKAAKQIASHFEPIIDRLTQERDNAEAEVDGWQKNAIF